jgi:hypothetical protein
LNLSVFPLQTSDGAGECAKQLLSIRRPHQRIVETVEYLGG